MIGIYEDNVCMSIEVDLEEKIRHHVCLVSKECSLRTSNVYFLKRRLYLEPYGTKRRVLERVDSVVG